jgi:ADP-ribose pyrophosphatase YjhB (NUDIX family)
MEKDCCFTNESNWFRYRAAAIIIENDSILLASNENSDYYYSVGGGVHMGETAEQAVIREVYEETGVIYEVDRLAFIHENFFDGNGIIEGKKCHEIAFYFLMKPRGTQEINSHSYCAEGKEYMTWIPIKELHKYKAYPIFFREKLLNMGSGIEHIVNMENK